MAHYTKHRKFNRKAGHRKALLRNLVKSLVKHEQMSSTLAKIKEIRPIAERMITKARNANLHDRRCLISSLGGDTVAVSKLLALATRYKDRPGGYTRIIKTGYRLGDAAPTAVIQFV